MGHLPGSGWRRCAAGVPLAPMGGPGPAAPSHCQPRGGATVRSPSLYGCAVLKKALLALKSTYFKRASAERSGGAAECRAWRGWPLTPMLGRKFKLRRNRAHRNARASQRLVSDGARPATDPRPTCGAQPTGGIPNLSEPGWCAHWANTGVSRRHSESDAAGGGTL